MNKPTGVVAVDFDGVIHNYKGWQGKPTINEPLDYHAMFKELTLLREHGWKVVIWTNRMDIQAVRDFLNDYSIPFDAVNENPWSTDDVKYSRKIAADVYIDDKALQFKGEWEGLSTKIMAFQPWWRKPWPGGESLQMEGRCITVKLKTVTSISSDQLSEEEQESLASYQFTKEEALKFANDKLILGSNYIDVGYEMLFHKGMPGEKFINGGVVIPSLLAEIKGILFVLCKRALREDKDVEKIALDIYQRRNKASGGSWRDVGLRGSLIEIHAKLSRLRAGYKEDNLVDLINYCIISLMCIKEDLIHVGGEKNKKLAIVTGCHYFGLGEVIGHTLRINGYEVVEIPLLQKQTLSNIEDLNYFREIMEEIREGHEMVYPSLLVNNYGTNFLSWIGDFSTNSFEVIDKNLKWPLMIADAYIRSFGKRIEEEAKRTEKPAARILNVCSQTYRIAQRCTSTYCASKAGLAHATKVMARELGPKGVVVNGIAPGLITDTMMSKRTNDQVLQLRGWEEDHSDDYARSLIPLGRYTNREEVAEAILRIIQLPDYITGTTIDMTGGQ